MRSTSALLRLSVLMFAFQCVCVFVRLRSAACRVLVELCILQIKLAFLALCWCIRKLHANPQATTAVASSSATARQLPVLMSFVVLKSHSTVAVSPLPFQFPSVSVSVFLFRCVSVLPFWNHSFTVSVLVAFCVLLL